MLKSQLLHPGILRALAGSGHGARILITDANFPASTRTPSSSEKVFLNLAPGLVTVTEVLRVLRECIVIESGIIMLPPDGHQPPIQAEFRELLGAEIALERLPRFDFYGEAASGDNCLTIVTGDTRRFANILITIGVLFPQS